MAHGSLRMPEPKARSLRGPLVHDPLARDPLVRALHRAALAPRGPSAGPGRTRFSPAGKPAGQRSGFAGTGRRGCPARGEQVANLSGSRTA
jgi:hypothetical protein